MRDVTRVYFGSGSDEPKPGDYTGDGIYDIGIFRESSGLWAVKGVTRVYYGTFGDVAIAAGRARTSKGLPPTGQTASYRSGDDGFYEFGAPFRYETRVFPPLVGTQWIVVDHKTGLIWPQSGYSEGCAWGQQTDWDSVIDWCNSLVFGGYDDWRLPNMKELQSIIDYGTDSPAIDTTYFTNTKWLDYYWTSTTVNNATPYAWAIVFQNGSDHIGDKDNHYYLRAVRGGELP